MPTDNIDHLSELPQELLEVIFKWCCETNVGDDNHVFIRYKYFSDHRLYQEYRGDMLNGVPHGNGIMYQGRRVYDEVKHEYLERGFETPWILLSLFEVYPKFEPKLAFVPRKIETVS